MMIEDYGVSINASITHKGIETKATNQWKAEWFDFDDLEGWVEKVLPGEPDPEKDDIYDIMVSVTYHGEGLSNTRMTVLSFRGFKDKMHYIVSPKMRREIEKVKSK